MTLKADHIRMAEAILFAATEPLSEDSIRSRLPGDLDVKAVLNELSEHYKNSGINLVCISGKWSFRTARDLAHILESHITQSRRLSKAGVETLAIIAYHQPVTRAEIEEIRGVAISKGTLDILFEAGWIKIKGRRRTPGRPITYGTSEDFLEYFGIDSINSLPGLDELKSAGLLRREPPASLVMPQQEQTNQQLGTSVAPSGSVGSEEGEAAFDSEKANKSIVPLKPR